MSLADTLKTSIALIEGCGEIADPGKCSTRVLKTYEEMQTYIATIELSLRSDIEAGKIPKVIRSGTDLADRLARLVSPNGEPSEYDLWTELENNMRDEGLEVFACVVPTGRGSHTQVVITVGIVE